MKAALDRDSGEFTITASAKKVALVLEDILRGRTPTRIARERSIPESSVIAIRDAHGYPQANTLRVNVARLIGLGDNEVTFPVPGNSTPAKDPVMTAQPTPASNGHPDGALRPDLSRAASPASITVATAVGGPADPLADPAKLTLTGLLALAGKHDQTKIRSLADKIKALAERLRADLVADVEDAKKRARIAALKAELAELQGTPRKSSGGSSKREPKSPQPEQVGGEFLCADESCERAFPSAQGARMHYTRTHAG